MTGSRGWTDQAAVHERLLRFPPGTVIVHGKARGADLFADLEARVLGFTVEPFPADWEKHGSRAGIIRNLAMLDTNPDLVLAFWDGQSPGTQHCFREAEKRGIPVEIIRG